MSHNVHHFPLIVLYYILCFETLKTSTRTSTLWKLNADRTKIVEASSFHQVVSYKTGDAAHGAQFITEDDPVFNIITSTVLMGGETWAKHGVEYYCTNCHTVQAKSDKNHTSTTATNNSNYDDDDEVLDCGKPVNFTYYDNLVGVLNRYRHPIVPEPQIGLIFTSASKNKKNSKGQIEYDINALERKLKKAKREKPKSVQLYNQIGNFWRIKGDAAKAIECFRRALAVSPHNSEVLLNLARVLFTLQYLDDAIFLTRRSLEVQAPEKGSWQHYFTLGEIFKAYGHYQEATVHLKHTLELKPGFEPAEVALKEMETMPPATIHVYTLVIIVFLVLGVLLVIVSSVEYTVEQEYPEVKQQRHFNKAMAMRSLRLGIAHKNCRLK